ncbi:hypothetical protein V8E54_005552 [Elaphomyces granulatus]
MAILSSGGIEFFLGSYVSYQSMLAQCSQWKSDGFNLYRQKLRRTHCPPVRRHDHPAQTPHAESSATTGPTLNEEDLGIISDERSGLLAELKAMMPDTKVSPTLWACLQIGEIDQIKSLKNLVKSAPLMADWISYVSDTIKELPLLWSQQVAPSSCKSSQIGSSTGKTANKSELKRSAKQRKLCLERDGRKCVVIGNLHPDVAHVFPSCMLKWKNSPLEQRLEGFWKLLSLFWPRDKINSWKAKVFSGEEGPDTCRNMICLEPTAHRLWTKGLFAFKPVKTSDDPSVLSLLFVWQPKYDHRKDDHIDIVDKPKSCKGLTGSSDSWLYPAWGLRSGWRRVTYSKSEVTTSTPIRCQTLKFSKCSGHYRG